MNSQKFWEKVSQEWGKKEKIEITGIDETEVPEDFIDDSEVESLDDLLNELGDLL